MKTIYYIIFALVAYIISSCQSELVSPTKKAAPLDIFEQVWKAIDEKYSYLEYKSIDWDSLGSVYRQQVDNSISEDSLFNVLGRMLFNLKDGHVNLRSEFNVSRNWEWFLDYPQNFDLGLLQRNYLSDFRKTNNLVHKQIKGVGYVYYQSFGTVVSDHDMDYIISLYKNTKGLIIDVRNNGGGQAKNAFTILNHLSSSPTLVGVTYEKSGPAHDDFGKPTELWTRPQDDGEKYLGKVILLTNRSCYSATSHFVAWAQALPNVTVIGDWTGGGGGVPTSIQLSNGWILRYSSTIEENANGFNIENGTPPDINVNMDDKDAVEGRDTILETALYVF